MVLWRRSLRAASAGSTLPLAALQRSTALAGSTRTFGSAYKGEMSDALRFDCVYPETKTLTSNELRGRAVLVVNTASQCASASQLTALQSLYDQFHARGLEIIAVPSNEFDKKEPGSDAEITMRYTANDGAFKVRFPIAKKTTVLGEQAHVFFDHIATRYGRSVAPTWNFDKFLVDAYGDLAAVFPHDTDPLEPEVLEAIEDALTSIPTAAALAAKRDSDSDSDDELYSSDEDGEDEDDEYDSSSDSEDDSEPTPRRR